MMTTHARYFLPLLLLFYTVVAVARPCLILPIWSRKIQRPW